MRQRTGQYNSGVRTPGNRRQKGFSLVEVLVTVVILVIGIFAVARLFPYGFLSIQHTGNISIAQAMARKQIEEITTPFNAISAALPDSNGNLIPINNIAPSDLSETSQAELQALQTAYNFTLPANYPLYSFSDVNRLRYVQGETFTIPAASPSVHLLKLGPVYNKFHLDASNNAADSILVTGAPLARSVQNEAGTADNPQPVPVLNQQNEYAIDYQNGAIAFYPRVANTGYAVPYRTFVVSYQGYPAGGLTPITYTLAVVVNDTGAGSASNPVLPLWQPIAGPGTTVLSPSGVLVSQLPAMIPGSETVSQKFRLVSSTAGPNQNFSTLFTLDPYEYAWYSPQETGNANLGALIFNPRGHVSVDPNNPASTASVATQPLQAVVNYLIYDNHILRENHTLSTAHPYNIQLSVPNVLQQGDTLPDGTQYDGLYHDVPGDQTTDETDLVVVNRSTGLPIFYMQNATLYSYNPANPYNPGTDVPAGIYDRKTSELQFQQSYIEANNLQNTPIRILYRTAQGWGMQLQQAALGYTSVASVGSNGLSPTQYYIGGGASGGLATRIYFSISEAGKTVVLHNVVYATASTTANDPTTYGNASDLTLQVGTLTDNVNGVQLVYANIQDDVPGATALSSAPTGLSVTSVQGGSLKSRVVWHDNNVNSTNIIWHKIDQDELMPAGGASMVNGGASN